jgi:hypothetical protein
MTTDVGSTTYQHALGHDGLFALRLRGGLLRLRAIDGEDATVRSTDGRPLDGLVIDAADRSLSISADPADDRLLRRANRSPELDIDLPVGTTIVVEVNSADIEATGFHGDQRYHSTSGNVDLRGVHGTLTVEAVSGDVDLITDGPAAITVRTVSGDLALRAGELSALRIVTTSGDLRIAGDVRGDGPFAIESVSGDVVIAPAGGLRLEAKTIAGDIRTDLDARRDEAPGSRALIVAGGGPTLTFRSTSGDLRIVRAATMSAPVPSARPAVPEAPAMPLPPVASNAPAQPASTATHPGAPTLPATDPLAILQALERGEIDVAEADRRLTALDPTDA